MIETSRFRLRSSEDEPSFLLADARVQSEFVYQQPGLVRRTTAKGQSAEWIVVTLWDSAAAADAAATAAPGHAACREFEALVDPSSVRIERFVERD